MDKLTNNVIKKLRSEKSRVLTIVKKHHRLEHILSEAEYKFHKAQLKIIKKLLSENTSIVFNKIVEDKLTSIDPKQSKTMFNEMKKNYKHFEPLNIEYLKIPNNKISVRQ